MDGKNEPPPSVSNIEGPSISPEMCACGAAARCACAACRTKASSNFVYALGTVQAQFPDQSISEELQSVARTMGFETEPKPDEPLRSWLHRVLSVAEARYVARKLCWILNIEGHPAYLLILRDLCDLDYLIECLGRNNVECNDLDMVVGTSSLIPTAISPGINIPCLLVDQICAFSLNHLTGRLSGSKKRASVLTLTLGSEISRR